MPSLKFSWRSASGRLCEFASVRNPAAQFFASENIFIALKQSLVNSPNRDTGVGGECPQSGKQFSGTNFSALECCPSIFSEADCQCLRVLSRNVPLCLRHRLSNPNREQADGSDVTTANTSAMSNTRTLRHASRGAEN